MSTMVKSKFKTTIDIHDKKVLNAVAEAIARARGVDVMPKDCRNDARTVMSAYILGQDVETAAQRLLTWMCIDCGMQTLYLNNASDDTVAKVMSIAKSGYAQLQAVDKYGQSFIVPQPRYFPGSPSVSPK